MRVGNPSEVTPPNQAKTGTMLEAADETLFHAWLDGDAAAGQVLVRRHYRRILRFFYAKVGPEVGKDLTQSTFETLCIIKLSFRGDSTLLTYLFGIARWKLVDYFRAQRAHRAPSEPLTDPGHLPEVHCTITSLFMHKQRESLVVQALRSLPLDDQIILELEDSQKRPEIPWSSPAIARARCYRRSRGVGRR